MGHLPLPCPGPCSCAALTRRLHACSTVVSGRTPWGRDAALDYDVMSDMEWEDEPEGESLSVRPRSVLRYV